MDIEKIIFAEYGQDMTLDYFDHLQQLSSLTLYVGPA